MIPSEYLDVPSKIFKSENTVDSFNNNAQCLQRLELGGKKKKTGGGRERTLKCLENFLFW